MAFTGSPTGSTQFNLQTAVTQGGIFSAETTGQLKIALFEYTHSATAGAGTGEINLITLPPGRIIVISRLSVWGVSVAWAAASTNSIGTRAFTQPDGTAVAASSAAFVSAVAVGAATVTDTVFALPAASTGVGGFTRLNSQSGVVLFSTVAAGNITVGGTLNGHVVWSDAN
jgi:hypothetical protein